MPRTNRSIIFVRYIIIIFLTLVSRIDVQGTYTKQVIEGERVVIDFNHNIFSKGKVPSNSYISVVQLFRDTINFFQYTSDGSIKHKIKNFPLFFTRSTGITKQVTKNVDKVNITVTFPKVHASHTGTYAYALVYQALDDNTRISRSGVVSHLYVHDITSPGKCQDGWTKFVTTDTCLKVFLHEESWENARAFCYYNHGGDLALVNSGIMDGLIDALMDVSLENKYWIGLTDKSGVGKFSWLDSSTKPLHTNWNYGEPALHKTRGKQLCGYKGESRNGTWYTTACDDRRKVVCERSTESKSSEYENKYSVFPTFSRPIIFTLYVLTFMLLVACWCSYYCIRSRVTTRFLLPVAKTLLGKEPIDMRSIQSIPPSELETEVESFKYSIAVTEEVDSDDENPNVPDEAQRLPEISGNYLTPGITNHNGSTSSRNSTMELDEIELLRRSTSTDIDLMAEMFKNQRDVDGSVIGSLGQLDEL